MRNLSLEVSAWAPEVSSDEYIDHPAFPDVPPIFLPQSHSRPNSTILLFRYSFQTYEMSSVQVVSATISSEVSPHTHTVTGTWDHIPSTAIPDAGSSRIISGTRVSIELPTPPPQASTHTPHQPLPQGDADPFDNFFGISHSSRIGGTHGSRHDTSPPPYRGEDLPAYSRWDEEAGSKEPPTLAMYLFKYGFCKSESLHHLYHGDL